MDGEVITTAAQHDAARGRKASWASTCGVQWTGLNTAPWIGTSNSAFNGYPCSVSGPANKWVPVAQQLTTMAGNVLRVNQDPSGTLYGMAFNPNICPQYNPTPADPNPGWRSYVRNS